MKRIFDKVCGVYKITNLVNGKIYIGSSIDIHVRWRGHLTLFKRNKHSHHFQNAWNRYGEDSFELEIIEEVPRRLLLKREQQWIDYYKSSAEKYGYNECPTAGSPAGKVVSKETRKKQSEWQKGRIPWNRGKRTIIVSECTICKKNFRQPWPHNRVKTCSEKCRAILKEIKIYRIRRGTAIRVNKQCIGCNKIFKGMPCIVRVKKYCTRSCYHRYGNKGPIKLYDK